MKKSFKIMIDGKELELAVKKPTNKQIQKADRVYSRVWREAVEEGAIVQAKVESVVKAQHLWDEDKQKEFEMLQKSILDNEYKLSCGGIKLTEAYQSATQMKKDRMKLRDLLLQRNAVSINTAEAQATNARFNYLVSQCLVYNDTGEQFFSTYDEYENNQNVEVIQKAGDALSNILLNQDENLERELPENKFFLTYGFMDENLRLMNKNKQFVDLDGRLVNAEGRLVNVNGELVDINGKPIDAKGNYKVDFTPFIED